MQTPRGARGSNTGTTVAAGGPAHGETVGRVLGGAVAEALLARDLPSVRVVGWVAQVSDVMAPFPRRA